MKYFSLILNFVLTVAVAILFYLHFSEKNVSTKTAEEPTTNTDSSSLNLNDSVFRTTAFINSDSLFEKYEYVKEMRDELATEKLKSESKYEAEMKKLEKEVMEFREKAQFMTQADGEAKQMELMQKEQELMKLEQQLSGKLLEMEQEKNKRIQKSVIEFLEKYNKEKKYAYIFGYNGLGNVLYADSQLDITDEIINMLNEEYKANKMSE